MKKINDTRIYGIFGFPLGHTLSPYFQEAAFQASGIPAQYLTFPLDEAHFKTAMKKLKPDFALSGFNVTVPYKETVLPYLDRLTPAAKAIGAVNTVIFEKGKWLGANTDGHGFLMSLKKDGHFNPRHKKALMLGAGGSAKAVAYSLAEAGVSQLTMVNRTLSKAQRLIRTLRKQFPRLDCRVMHFDHSDWRKEIAFCDLIVNTTSVGLRQTDKPLLRLRDIPPARGRKKLFYDLIYNPSETIFLRQARRKGHRGMNGLGMLFYQGVRSFELWTKKKAPERIMRDALIRAYRGVEK